MDLRIPESPSSRARLEPLLERAAAPPTLSAVYPDSFGFRVYPTVAVQAGPRAARKPATTSANIASVSRPVFVL